MKTRRAHNENKHETRTIDPTRVVAVSHCGTNWSPQLPVIGLALCTRVDNPSGNRANTGAGTGTTQTAKSYCEGLKHNLGHEGVSGDKHHVVGSYWPFLLFWGPGAFPARRRPGLPGDQPTAGLKTSIGRDRISECARDNATWVFSGAGRRMRFGTDPCSTDFEV